MEPLDDIDQPAQMTAVIPGERSWEQVLSFDTTLYPEYLRPKSCALQDLRVKPRLREVS
jgi:hypothetical protein